MKGPLLLAILCSICTMPAFAHTTVSVGPYDIEAGWGIEPPVVELKNSIVFELSEPGEVEGAKRGILNGFQNLEATVKFGGLTKTLDIHAETRAGHYSSPIIPTKTGSMSVLVAGEINGVPVDVEIPIEDVESTAVLDFPPRSATDNESTASLKAAITELQNEIRATGNQEVSVAAGPAYDFAIFGMSLGAAGVILAVIAMIRRR